MKRRVATAVLAIVLAGCGGTSFTGGDVAERTRDQAESTAGNPLQSYDCQSTGKDKDGQEGWDCTGIGAGTTSAADVDCQAQQNGERLETVCGAQWLANRLHSTDR
jgi:hypothetical protein